MLCFKKFPFEGNLSIVSKKFNLIKENYIYDNQLYDLLEFIWKIQENERPSINNLIEYLNNWAKNSKL